MAKRGDGRIMPAGCGQYGAFSISIKTRLAGLERAGLALGCRRCEQRGKRGSINRQRDGASWSRGPAQCPV